MAERHARVLQLENQLMKTNGDGKRDNQTIDSILKLTEKVLRALDDYKTNISFLEAELAEIDFRQQEANSGCLNNSKPIGSE